MSPDRVGVKFRGSQRQVDRPPRWAEPSMSGDCYTVIKNDSVSYLQRLPPVTTEEAFGHNKYPEWENKFLRLHQGIEA